MAYTVFVPLEPYLAQWLQHEFGGEYPIHIKHGSAEAEILACFLRPQPKKEGYVPQHSPLEGQVEVKLPWFKHKDIRIYNYLSPKAAVCLHACIRNRFKVALWKDLYTVRNVTRRTDITIEEWMVSHGIELDERNWNTIAKILQRCRAIYCVNNRLTNNKTSKHRTKT